MAYNKGPQQIPKQVQKLTLDERVRIDLKKQKFELQKELFVTIRLIDMVEKCAHLSDDKITPEKHFEETTKLLDRYNNFKSKVEGFDLQKFILVIRFHDAKEYNLEDCKFGIDRIKSGPPQLKGTNRIQLVKEMMQKFFQTQDILLANQDNPKVAVLKPHFDQLVALIERSERELPKFDNHKEELKKMMDKAFANKQVIEVLTEEELSNLQTVLDLAQTSFMNSNQ